MNQNSEWIPDEVYAEHMKHFPICCVDILLFNETKTKVLLCKRNNEPLKGVYFSTGGRLYKGETPEDCAVRKAEEELGVKISKGNLLKGGVISETFENSSFGNDVGYHTITLYFGYSISENTVIKLDKQHTDCRWFDVDNIDIHPNTKERIDTILKNL